MKVSDFDYVLPESSIALYPPAVRGATRLEVLSRDTGSITHARYADLHRFLEPGDLLVLNNTRVVLARLFASKKTGAKIELVLLEKHEHVQNLVMYRGRLKQGDILLSHGEELRVDTLAGNGIAAVSCVSGRELASFFQEYADVPIPPYLRRDAEEVDRERYQTVFAEIPGSVAAPTASLNMTPQLIGTLRDKDVQVASVTLHVGLGTFMPIRVDDLASHVMHREYYDIPAGVVAAIRSARDRGGRVVAVGTTVTRALEHASPSLLDANPAMPVRGEADIFIYPGYRFRIIDALLTNYHAPRSTVLMLTAAFAGWDFLRNAYEEALRHEYRFLSYGDSMLIL